MGAPHSDGSDFNYENIKEMKTLDGILHVITESGKIYCWDDKKDKFFPVEIKGNKT